MQKPGETRHIAEQLVYRIYKDDTTRRVSGQLILKRKDKNTYGIVIKWEKRDREHIAKELGLDGMGFGFAN